ncbi:MAG: NADH:ubiquinone reductase (Na(+)-transporting) subunit B [Bacteroidetes bacterium]|nr:NADH:ubiquinone reductase (Na(+)-transporting) subunit B [Bacteroidota bacterium]
MKFIRDILDKIKPDFEKGGKFEKFWPAYNAFDVFLFTPAETTQTGSHIRDAVDLKRTMSVVILALMPCLFFGMWNTGYQHFRVTGVETGLWENFFFGLIKIFPIIVVSYVSGLTVEFIFAIKRGHPVNEGFLVTGMLIPLVMPVTIPLWMVAVATVFAVILGKEAFGGTGMNVLNPALLARAFIFFAYPAQISGEVWNDLTLGEGQKIINGYSGATSMAVLDYDYHNLPPLNDLITGTIQGSIGETSKIAIAIGALILLVTGIGSWRIMLSMFIGGLAMGFFFNNIAPAGNPAHPMNLPAYYHWLIGGFAFGAVFMATDPVTAAQTNTGKYIYGFLIGVFAVILRVVNPAYPEGVMLAILFFNVFAPLIDHYVIQSNISRRVKRWNSTDR